MSHDGWQFNLSNRDNDASFKKVEDLSDAKIYQTHQIEACSKVEMSATERTNIDSMFKMREKNTKNSVCMRCGRNDGEREN